VRRSGAVALALVLLAGACGGEAAPEPEPPVAVDWRPATLPMPAGAAGSLIVRDAVACPGAWFATGAVRDSSGGTRPAAWTSPDARTWTALRVAARTYYGRQNVLYTVACRDGRMAAVGAKTGGAHAYPRTSSWQQTADGVLREVTAPFELFGGPQMVNVARLDAGPRGFLISGNRMSGAAVWRSGDAAEFEIRERVPVLATDAAGETWAFDGTATAGGWLVVGGLLPKGRIDRDPMGWRSADGTAWQRVPAADATDRYEELQRVTVLDGVPLALGVSGPAFAAWRLDGDRWRPAGSFGSVRPGGSNGVRALATAGRRLFATTSDGAAYALWVSDDRGASWRPATVPGAPTPGPETAMVVSGGDGRAVLLSDDGKAGQIHVAETGA
jgi:hypothetical protein